MKHTLKQLHYRFPYLLNPYAMEMEEEIDRWITSFKSLDEVHRIRIREARFGHVTARFFPNASYRHTIVQALLMVWYFIIDDTQLYTPVNELEKIHQRFMDLLNGRPDHAPEDDLCRMLMAIKRVLVEDMSPEWMSRFAESLHEYLEAVRAEVPYRTEKRFPTQEEYMQIREFSVGMWPTIDMIELVTGQELPVELLQNPHIHRLRQLACYCVIMVNDFFSAHKEEIGGDVFNQVLIIQHERGCTLDEAREELLKMHEHYKNEFLSLRLNLPPFGAYQQLVISYLRELEAQVIGHLNWYLFDTERYKYNIL
ncbi:terpene synthase family protein [Chitinophaga sp. RAB17]|uniref:terpene synthase family protein n=1 Tax=Chitinophaga sp. RAB17 TaxID=3233049 RepID=UPI003F926D65